MRYKSKLIIALSALAVGQAQTPPKFRLGEAVKPVRYRADLTILPATETFTGSIEIDLQAGEPTSVVWLHAVDIDIRGAKVRAGTTVRVVAGKDDFAGFSFEPPLAAGPATLQIDYQGKLYNKHSDGLFRIREGGDWYVFSQFEPTDARRAFPCFDEPSFKVPWLLTLRIPKDTTAVSNTPIESESQGDRGLKIVRFAETKPLPSYLVALAVGPFDFVDAGRAGKKRTLIRIVTPRGRGSEAGYAVQTTGQILARLENYFGSPYPYEKLDHVAIPMVMFGAMENPGLVTYQQTILLSKPEDETVAFRRGYVSTTAHELAHQWFGDLVTMAWWDDVWLNEAFASWMGAKIVNQWKPEWDLETSEIASRSFVMDQDGLISARRIRQPIESKNDIPNAFDGITYTKGAAVIQMFENWVGADKFQKGVQRYLTGHTWGNATARDFLAAVDIAPAFSTFLDQAGVPLVSTELRCDGSGPPAMELSQKRFLPLGSAGSSQQTWQIPVCVKYGTGDSVGRECTLLTGSLGELRLKKETGCPDWVLANAEQTGYYRTLYHGDLMDRLLRDGGKRLTAAERAGVLGDVRAMVKSGDISIADALALIPEFSKDANRHVVTTTIAIVEDVSGGELVPTDLWPNFTRFIRKVYGSRARALAWQLKPGENDETRLLRNRMLRLVAGTGDDPQLAEEACALADRWLQDRRAVDAETVDTVLWVAAQHGDKTFFDRLHAAARKTQDRKERARLLDAMASFRNRAVVRESLSLLLADDFDTREATRLLWGPLGRPETRGLPYEFMKQNFDALNAKLPRALGGDFAAELPFLAAGFCDPDRRADVEAFFQDRITQLTGGPRNLAQALERIDLCIARRAAQQSGVVAFLKNW